VRSTLQAAERNQGEHREVAQQLRETRDRHRVGQAELLRKDQRGAHDLRRVVDRGSQEHTRGRCVAVEDGVREPRVQQHARAPDEDHAGQRETGFRGACA
jgi:hypothetical protein